MLINNKEDLIIKEETIRYHQDEKSGEFYFSIVDIIDNLDLSQDPRNYWKVLKNRLNKRHHELVTECNQLKMRASDGKFYLTDAVKVSTALQIIELIFPEKVSTFEEFFNHMDRKNLKSEVNFFSKDLRDKDLSTASIDDEEIEVDMYQKDNCLFLIALLAGVDPEDIFISLNCKILTIKVNRVKQNNGNEENYNYQELSWGKFSRMINLPYEVDIDRVEANSSYGILTIKLCILDKTRTTIVKVK